MTFSEIMSKIADVMGTVSQWAIPALIMVIILSAAKKRVPMYESFYRTLLS